jgi:DnaJ-class molecular chaperone
MNPYETLNIPCEADAATIRKAHRKAARASHPDHGGSTEAFLAVQKSYEILTDPERKARYDATGDTKEIDLRKEAVNKLVGLVIQFAEQRDWSQDDMVHAMIRSVKDGIERGHQSNDGLRKQGAKLRATAERISTKGQNILAAALEKRAGDCDNQIAANKTQLQIGELMVTMLGDYNYRVEKTQNNVETEINNWMRGWR